MKRLLRTCVALLAVSLLLTAYFGLEVNAVVRDLDDLRTSSQRLQSLQSELASMRAALEELREASEWVTPVDITIGQRQGDVIPVSIDWQVKELAEGSTVTLYLKHADDLNYTAYEASSTGGGGYRVVFEYPYRLKPEINVGVSHTYQDGQKSSVQVETLIGGSEDRYDYYISVSGNGQQRTTEADSIDLGKVGSRETGPLSVDIRFDDGDLRVTASEEPQSVKRFRPNKATFRIVSGENQIVVPLTMSAKQQDDYREFEGEVKDAPSDVDHCLLILEYSDGTEVRIVEKVIRV